MLRSAFILIFLAFLGSVSAQSASALESRLRSATDKNERMNLYFQLARQYYQSNASRSADYAYKASELAIQLGQKRTEAEALQLSADALYRSRKNREADARYQQAWQAARNYGYRDIAAHATERLMDINQASSPSDAVKWARESIKYLKDGGGASNASLESRLRAAESENRTLREQLAKATGQTQLLETNYRETEAALQEVKVKTQEEILKRESELSQITQEKQRVDSLNQTKAARLELLSKGQLADSVIKAEQMRELQTQKRLVAEAELARQESEFLRNFLALLASFVLVVAFLFYLRYRAKKRTANQLSAQNRVIEAEKTRSDNLLLNILPPAIAQELKTNNKVAAQKYDHATVLFLDFKGFTQISERLTPENLVEELDYCFSNFDKIIEKYRIEKIKTIGDAYLCASGLSDKNANPSDMIKAALDMQDFLLHHKAERMGLDMPFFEARIGIHTGPVVAGVVGAKKFAYDIWGDTVNIAARFQEECEIGRVNVSEHTYQLAKYEFEWQYRGKIAAKNKGMLDMYYVLGVKQF